MQYYIQLFSLLMCLICLGDAQYCYTSAYNRLPDGYCVHINQCWYANQNYLPFNSYCNQYFGYGSVCCPYYEDTNKRQPPTPSTTTPPPITTNVKLPQPGVCGVLITNRILYGEDTAIEEFPWMALIEHTNRDGSKSHNCGGVLINKNYVLTASHCVKTRQITKRGMTLTGVRLGEWDLRIDPDCDENESQCADPFQDIRVSDAIQHEDFNENSMANDIALLRLEYPVTYTDWIKPICLPVLDKIDNAIVEGTNLTVAGWGKTETGRPSGVKKKAELSVAPHSRCNRAFRAQRLTMTNGQLCAQSEGKQDSCNGDSGGPFMYQHRSGKHVYFYLAGIVSFGANPCGQSGIPSVYTRVHPYINWISDNMKP